MHSPIAIVGISAEFPSGKAHSKNLDHNTFFEFLLNKEQAYEKIPSDRFNIESWHGPYAGQVVTDTGAFLKDVTLFDHLEFGITALDAKNMALSTRKLIEHSFLALLDSGIDYRGRNVGCFTSGVSFDLTTLTEPDEMDARGSFAGQPYGIANKVSYHLDLRGPSLPTDTACSSTSVALHLAVQSVRAGECEAAVVGGCQLNYRLIDFIQYSQGGLLAPDGKCKPFDSSANGFSRGEGVCTVVIKLLEDAIRDGDHIYASILGTGINSSGGAAPVSAPVAAAQENAMRRAFANTGKQPSQVDFVELHATGTAVGDPTEANWVGKAFQREDEGDLLIGSVKGNIGHLEITAFLASLSKVCSIFQTGLLPPNVNFHHPNPSIKWDEYHLRVPTETTKLQPRSPSGKILVSMASSGIGGANGHMVLESPPHRVTVRSIDPSADPILVCVGGLSPRSTSNIANGVQTMMENGQFTKHTAIVYGRRSRQMTWRTYTVFNPADLPRIPKFPEPMLAPKSKPPLVFVFSGQGPQHINMGRDLYRRYPTFRDTVDLLDAVHTKLTGYSLIKDVGLFGERLADCTLPEIWPIAITLPALCMVQLGVFDLLKSFGIHPDVVIGHSAGEAAMMYASGAVNRDLALEISIARGIAMTRELEEADGAMAAVNCSFVEANMIHSELSILGGSPDVLDIACHNSDSAFVFSGTRSLVEKAVELAKSRGMFARLLRTRIPVHSGLMELCREKYQQLITEAFGRYSMASQTFYPSLPSYSCLNGKRWTGPFTPDYIWKTARHPVLFSKAILSILHETPTACFLEISPHPVLTSYISELAGTRNNTVFATLKRAKKGARSEELPTFLSAVGNITALGYNISAISDVHGCDKTFDVHIPPYPFAKKEIEYFSRSSSIITRQLALGRRPLYDPHGELRLSSSTHPDIAAHVIRGESIMPAAGYIEMAFESGARQLFDIEFRSIMPLPRDTHLLVKFTCSGSHWQVASRTSDQLLASVNMVSRLHAEGYMSMNFPSGIQETITPLDEIISRCRKIDVNKFYENLQYFSSYGRIFQRVELCYLNDTEALVAINTRMGDIANTHRYIIHPAILDSCLHIMVSPSFTGNSDRFVYYLPSRIREVNLYRPDFFPQSHSQVIYSHVKVISWDPDHICYDLYLRDVDGSVICSMYGFRASKHTIEQNQLRRGGFDLVNIPVESINAKELLKRYRDHSVTSFSAPLITSFKHEGALTIKRAISEFKQLHTSRLWIQATHGADAFAALGFVRSLSKETPDVKISLVVFDAVWGEDDRKAIIAGISNLADIEQEIFVDADGVLKCPRIVPFDVPADDTLPRQEELWTWDNEKKSLNVTGRSTIDRLKGALVRFSRITSTAAGGFRAFLGIVIQSEINGLSLGTTIAGITSSATISNHAVIPDGYFIPVTELQKQESFCDILLPILIIRFAIGLRIFHDSFRSSLRIVYVETDDAQDKLIISLLKALGIEVLGIHQSRLCQLSTDTQSSDLVISSATDKNDISAIQRLSRADIPVFLFNDELSGIRRIIQVEPWVVKETWQTFMPIAIPPLPTLESISVNPIALVPKTVSEIRRDLFDSSKSYVLMGGIGSLGLHIALWMYQNGARHLILTSRRGASSLEVHKDLMAKRILHYLETRPDLEVQVQACDATSGQQVANLINSLEVPIAGCMLLSAVLSDRLFMSHTEETYYSTFAPKLGAFEALSCAVDVRSLDFLVSSSSAATFGNAGQTNYASANTQLDGELSSYPNAFSLVCPAIIDTVAISNGDELAPDERYQSWIPWAMTSKQICECLGDGIRKLAMGPFTHYIPDLNWNHVQSHFGKSPMYDSMVTTEEDTSGVAPADSGETLLEEVAKHLYMETHELADNVPLTSYGLDSLSAGRLALALKPLVSVTQLQLLGDMALKDLRALVLSPTEQGNISQISGGARQSFDWTNLNQLGETVVKLVEGNVNDIPLILIHGGTGDITTFIPIQERFKTSLWAIQSSPDAPRDSLKAIASYYHAKLKEERSNGPYRLAGYSAGSILAFEIVRMLERNGDIVNQLVLLDHFPSLFLSPMYPLDTESLETGKPSNALMDSAFLSLIKCYERDTDHGRDKVVNELINVHKGGKGRSTIEYSLQYYQEFMKACLQFLLGLGGSEQRYNSSNVHLLRERMKEWLGAVSAPITVAVATRGIGAELLHEPEWRDLGVKSFVPHAEVLEIPYGHFDMFESEELVRLLETSSKKRQTV